MFQSTHPQGVRLLNSVLIESLTEFQSTHPQGVRPQSNIYLRLNICFNPRTRRGCDTIVMTCAVILSVSIHAPAGGATAAKV